MEIVNCMICFKQFKSLKGLSAHIIKHKLSVKQYYDKFLRKNEVKCLFCNKNTKFKNLKFGYYNFCSTKCVSRATREKSKQTCLKKYGVENPNQFKLIKEKKKQTCLKKYGVENPSQDIKIKERKKQTYLKNYGVDNPNKCIQIQNKIKNTCINNNIYEKSIIKAKQTCIKKYGVNHPSQLKNVKEKRKRSCLKKYAVEQCFASKEIQEKIKQTCLRKYGTKNPSQSLYIKQKKFKKYFNRFLPIVKKTFNKFNLKLLEEYTSSRECLKVICNLCNTEFTTTYFNIYQGCNLCPKCYPRYSSVSEQEISNFICNLGFNIEKNNRFIIKPLELDIYIPNNKIAIEYNGLYWHSEFKNKRKNYHLNKLKLCNEKSIRLIQIFEDEWLFKQDIVKARLKQILNINNSKRIHGRLCKIKEISNDLKDKFLNTYHIQGQDTSNIKLGAFYNEELVAVMTFSKGNIAKGSHFKENIWELNRFCNNYNYHIPGIASKLLTYFKRNYQWKEIYSYADRRWSQGNLYYKLGFELEKETQPNYWYVKGLKRIHRFSLRKRPDEPKDIPEWILRMQEGYIKIWDCGHLKFIFK